MSQELKSRPEWVSRLTFIQEEFSAVSGKTFHSSWEDFLFVKLSAAEANNTDLLKELKAAVQNLTMAMLVMDKESRSCAMECIKAHKEVIEKATRRHL